VSDTTNQIGTAWVLICIGITLVTQAGLICLPTGLVRANDSIKVAIKWVLDFYIASILLWLFGSVPMFEVGVSTWNGTTESVPNAMPTPSIAPCFFQLEFCL
jgi:Amt family ammonium transporter